jgi:hypothetical protein
LTRFLPKNHPESESFRNKRIRIGGIGMELEMIEYNISLNLFDIMIGK